MDSFPRGDLAIVIGATGGIGGALARELGRRTAFATTLGFSRSGSPALDLCDESTIASCAAHAVRLGVPRLILDATGVLHSDSLQPEKSLRQLNAAQMTEAFAIKDRKSTRLNSSHIPLSRMPSSA